GIEVDFLRLAVEVAWLDLPLLAFTFVWRQLDGVAAREAKGFVDVQQCLDPVVAGRDVAKTFGGIAESGGVDHGGLPGTKAVDIHAKSLLRFEGAVAIDLEPGLLLVVGGDQQKDVAVERSGTGLLRKRNFEAERGGGGRLGSLCASDAGAKDGGKD